MAVSCMIFSVGFISRECAVGHTDDILVAIARIHAAGLNADEWPDALRHLTNLIGGHGASLEFIQRPSLQHSGMFSYGLPAVGAYLQQYAPMCPRIPYAVRQPAGAVQCDAQYYDDAAMDKNPFYMEFLSGYGMRYFLGGIVANVEEELVMTGVQISPKQGHPSPTKIKLMALLLPHVQQATEVMRRLGRLEKRQAEFERTLDFLIDGVVMLAADGSVRYANVAAQAIFRANDAITVRRGAIAFKSRNSTTKLGAAIKAIRCLRDCEVESGLQSEFMVERPTAPAYAVSVYPLLAPAGEPSGAIALVFVHDPLSQKDASAERFRQLFNLTRAEAKLAGALCSGLSPDQYAEQNHISTNTVYTHIRHLKEKTGGRRMTELIRKLNDAKLIGGR